VIDNRASDKITLNFLNVITAIRIDNPFSRFAVFKNYTVNNSWGGDKYSYKPCLSKVLALRPF